MILKRLQTSFTIILTIIGTNSGFAQQNPLHLAQPNTEVVQDVLTLASPADIKLSGLLGARYFNSERNRLLNVNEGELLEGFRHKPGKQAWIGEHVGKFLHAASLSYSNTGDPALRAKIDRVASELIKTQEPDGYLGTYVKDKRFGLFENADWDVWVHKYDLLGLLTYYQYTGDKQALSACIKIGDLLINTFGPNKKSIISAGTHVGMASCSILEPVVLLYRATGERKFLDFAKYIVAAYDEPAGPHVVQTLLKEKSVRKTANAKAYEMTSNLVGLCELYRANGDVSLLTAATNAWDDIVKNRLYITGSGSSFEVWQDENHLPNGNNSNICETCVTVSWEQLNIELLRLTGDSKYADQLERSVYNHLLGAQRPDGKQWCYYTPLEGIKPYGNSTNCCLSSGPRGVALLPTYSIATSINKRAIFVNLYNPLSANVLLGDTRVHLAVTTDYPISGDVSVKVNSAKTTNFQLNLRVPSWATNAKLSVNDKSTTAHNGPGGYLSIQRKWRQGDVVKIHFDIHPIVIKGSQENAGRVAYQWGPLVLARDTAHTTAGQSFNRILLSDNPVIVAKSNWSSLDPNNNPVLKCEGMLRDGRNRVNTTVQLVPFYNAGADGKPFQVWSRTPASIGTADSSVLIDSKETRSRMGNMSGQILDSDLSRTVVTFDGTLQKEDWFGAEIDEPITFNQVTFAHGQSFHDGGWFDTSTGKPVIQIKRTKTSAWEQISVLESYPSTTSSRVPRIKEGQKFVQRFPSVTCVGIRIVGKPASGDNPRQAFSSCSLLQAILVK